MQSQSQQSDSQRIADILFRLMMIGCVVWIGWFTASVLHEVLTEHVGEIVALSEPKPGTEATSPPQGRTAFASLDLSSLTAGGRWRFAGTPLRVYFTKRDKDRVIEELDALPSASPSAAEVPASAALLGLMKSMKTSQRHITTDITVYALNQQNVMARLFTRGTMGEETVLAARLALPSEKGWILLETDARQEDTLPSPPFLLPLPGTVRRLCDRSDEDGKTVVEVVSTTSSWKTLQEFWRQHGWTVEPLAPNEERNGSWTCRREGERIDVLGSYNSDKQDSLLLLLLRVPSVQVNHE